MIDFLCLKLLLPALRVGEDGDEGENGRFIETSTVEKQKIIFALTMYFL
jgi:hypothetical protein